MHKLFKRISSAFMAAAIMMSSVVSIFASAAETLSETKNTEHAISDWGYDFSGSGLPNAYDPITQSNSNNQFRYKWANNFFYWTDSDGKYCYCVQLGTNHVNSVTMEELDLLTKTDNYYSKNQQKNLGYATIYGYKGTTKYGYSWKEELIATQCMIWAISGKYFDESSTALSANETTLLNCIKAPSSAAKANMIDCYKKMKADVLSHTTKPKGFYDDRDKAEAVKTTLKYNATSGKWEATISSDSYLSAFTAQSVSGVTFTQSGNSLKVSASEAGMKKLESLGTVTFTKTKALYASKIENCSPVFLVCKTGAGSSQAKISYYSQPDPVEAYMAFEGAYGTVTITKTASDTDNKTYTATAAANKALNSAVRFKIKTSDGKYVNASRSAAGQYTFSQYSTGTSFALGTDGKFSITGMPAGTYTLIETATADGYAKAEDKSFTVSAGSTASASVVNIQESGDLLITKKLTVGGKTSSITTADNWSNIRSSIRFVLTDSKGNYIDCTGSNGSYTYKGTRSTAQQLALTTDGKLSVSDLPAGKYNISEVTVSGVTFKDLRLHDPSAVSVIINAGGTTTKTITNKGYGSKEVYIVKEIIPYDDDEDVTDEMWENIRFHLQFHGSDGQLKDITVKMLDAENGIYEFVNSSGGADSEDPNTHIYLGSESHTASVINIPEEEFSGLEWAYVREVAVGYVSDQGRYSVLFDGDQSGTVKIINTETSGSVEVIKKTTGSMNLEGIEFVLFGTSSAALTQQN